jgi:hypothetical protein
MINFIVKMGVFIQLWCWIKPWLRTLFIPAVLITVTLFTHSEYLDYLEKIDSIEYLALSYFIKWTVIILTLVYFIFSVRNTKEVTQVLADSTGNPDKNDGFDFIRKKKHLDSYTDKLIKNKPTISDKKRN